MSENTYEPPKYGNGLQQLAASLLALIVQHLEQPMNQNCLWVSTPYNFIRWQRLMV